MITDKQIEAAAKARWYFHEEKEGSWEREPEEVRQHELQAAKVALEAAEAVRPSGWQPMETAPKDGSEVLILYNWIVDGLVKSTEMDTFYFNNKWIWADIGSEMGGNIIPIYWHYIPPPPTAD